MATTERILGGLMSAGILACLAMMAWPTAAPIIAAVEAVPSAPVPDQSIGEGERTVTQPELAVDRGIAANDALRAWTTSSPTSVGCEVGVAPVLTTVAIEDGVPWMGAVVTRESESDVVLSGVRVTLAIDASTLVADADGNGELSLDDRDQFEAWWNDGLARADLNGDGEIDLSDFAAFAEAFDTGERRGGVVWARTLKVSEGSTIGAGSNGGTQW